MCTFKVDLFASLLKTKNLLCIAGHSKHCICCDKVHFICTKILKKLTGMCEYKTDFTVVMSVPTES